MNDAIGEVLAIAIGIAISPLPVAAAVLILLAPRAKTAGPAFLVGWIAGLVSVVTLTILLSGLIAVADETQARPVVGVIKLLIGVALIGLAVRQFATRPRSGIEPVTPKWMAGIATMTVARAALLGFLSTAVNPKNLLLGVAAGVAISGAALAASSNIALVVVVVLLGSVSVAVPVIANAVAPKQMAAPLEGLRLWLLKHNSAVMMVIFVIMGVQTIGNAIASF